MKDPSAPEKGRGRPDDESDRTSRKPKSDGGTIPNPPTPVKRLLANWGTVWLFEVTFPTRVAYWERWGFSLRYSAEGKFSRLARAEGGYVE